MGVGVWTVSGAVWMAPWQQWLLLHGPNQAGTFSS